MLTAQVATSASSASASRNPLVVSCNACSVRGDKFVAERVQRLIPLLDLEMIAVRVTAADFNGKEFDGSPLKGVKSDDERNAMIALMEVAKVEIQSRGCTDYAWFGVKDDYGNVHWAGPGDYVVAMMTDPSLIADESRIAFKLMVVPGPFFDLYLSHLS
jgi:hypothetical protein